MKVLAGSKTQEKSKPNQLQNIISAVVNMTLVKVHYQVIAIKLPTFHWNLMSLSPNSVLTPYDNFNIWIDEIHTETHQRPKKVKAFVLLLSKS